MRITKILDAIFAWKSAAFMGLIILIFDLLSIAINNLNMSFYIPDWIIFFITFIYVPLFCGYQIWRTSDKNINKWR